MEKEDHHKFCMSGLRNTKPVIVAYFVLFLSMVFFGFGVLFAFYVQFPRFYGVSFIGWGYTYGALIPLITLGILSAVNSLER